MTQKKFSFPGDDAIIAFIEANGPFVSKKDIAKNFSIQGMEDRRDLKEALRRLVGENRIIKEKGRNFSVPLSIPAVTVLIVTGVDTELNMICLPEKEIEGLQQKYIPCVPETGKSAKERLRNGDRILAQLVKKDGQYWGKPIRKLGESRPDLVGVLHLVDKGAIVTPTDRRIKEDYFIPEKLLEGAKNGDLVKIQPEEKRGHRPTARIAEILGASSDPRNFSLIAIHENGIRHEFSDECLKEAEKYDIPPLGKRTDLRKTPLVTIDGEDARDFDDAVFAEPHPEKQGWWNIIVAIADVAYYVRPDSKLDKEARLRGNSVYFPDRVVPMLPEALSNGLCSLKPHEDRACMAAFMTVDDRGALRQKSIKRALMRSAERLTYTKVEHYIKGQTDQIESFLHPHIDHLYAVYKTLRKARDERGALDIRSNEQKVIFDDQHRLKEVRPRERFISHEIIEELMVLANVATAELLDEKNSPSMYRVHDKPSMERLNTARSFLAGFGYKLPLKPDITPHELNSALNQSEGRQEEQIIHETILRAQSTAIYHPDNLGHFGLGLEQYVHFTSPIRRYADLLIHRLLIDQFNLGEGGLQKGDENEFHVIAEHISSTERAASKAERESLARYTASYLADHQGSSFQGQISGVNDFGVFIRLNDLGAEGIIPIKLLPRDYYIYDEKSQALIGKYEGRVYRLLSTLMVKLLEVEPLKGSLLFEPVGDAGANHEGFKEQKSARGEKFQRDNRNRDRKKPPFKGRKNDKFKGKPKGNKGKSKRPR